MKNYVIFTDSACDIPLGMLEAWGVKCCGMTFVFDGSSREYSSNELSTREFYDKMRSGGVAKTSAINTETFKAAFGDELKKGNDILYIGFSTGLSATFNSGRIAAEELQAEYPERKLLMVDSLSASAGFGLLVYLTVQRKNGGATIEEAAQFAMDTRLHLCHWFTVDDLAYLKRGGRISSTAAFVGGMLGIKPVLHMDDEGHLINMQKVSGRKASIKALLEKYGELAIDPKGGTVFISHGDCIEDAEKLREGMAKTYSAKVELIADIGPIIGAHSGPGTLALFFVGKER